MENKMQRYRYSLPVALWSAGIHSIFVLTGIAVLPKWVRTVFSVLSTLLSHAVPGQEELGFLWAPWVSILVGATLLSLYTEVIVTEKGMRARVLLFFWKFIPWKDVLGITVTPIPGSSDPSRMRCVQVRRLTFFHRILGICYLAGIHPVLFINKHIEDYEGLVEVIEEHIEQNQLSADDTGSG